MDQVGEIVGFVRRVPIRGVPVGKDVFALSRGQGAKGATEKNSNGKF